MHWARCACVINVRPHGFDTPPRYKRRLLCAHTDHRFAAALDQPNCWTLLPPCGGMAHLIKSDAETKNFKEDDITMLSKCPADFQAHFEKAQEVSS